MNERRFLVPDGQRSALLGHLTALANPLCYRVSNVYFDDSTERFSQTRPGSPRLRLRLYEAGPWRFGHLELKSLDAGGRAHKLILELAEHWQALTSLAPFLQAKPLSAPPATSAYGCLVRSGSSRLCDLGELRFLTTLSYQRISFQIATGRMTVDFDFSPALQMSPGSLLEIKAGLPEADLAALRSAFSLRHLGESKFSLLMKRGM